MREKEPTIDDLDEIENGVCELCGGTGEIDEDVWNNDSHCYEPTGSRKCACQIRKEQDEDLENLDFSF